MTTIAKHLTTLVLTAIFVLHASAQKKDGSFQMHGYTFPYTTMDQLMRYCDMDSTSFDSTLRSMDFTIEENIYTKGSLDKSKMVFGKSRDFGTSIVWISSDTTVSIVDKLLQKFAHPTNVSYSEGFSFMYKKYVITVKSSQTGLRYEEINIIDKANYNQNTDN